MPLTGRPPSEDSWNALRSLVRFAVFAFVVACIALVAGVLLLIEDGGFNSAVLPLLPSAFEVVRSVLAPLFQLFVVLVLIEWFLKRMGIGSISANVARGLEWNTQTIIAVIVIGAFSAAALGGLTVGLSALKDVALVVVGFYFGTQRRVIDVETEHGKMRQVIEHDNPVLVKADKARNAPATKTPDEDPDSSQQVMPDNPGS